MKHARGRLDDEDDNDIDTDVVMTDSIDETSSSPSPPPPPLIRDVPLVWIASTDMGREQCENTYFSITNNVLGRGGFGTAIEACQDRNCAFVVKVIQFVTPEAYERDVFYLRKLRQLVDDQWAVKWDPTNSIRGIVFENRKTGAQQHEAPVEQIAPYLFDFWICSRSDQYTPKGRPIKLAFVLMERFDMDVHSWYRQTPDAMLNAQVIVRMDSLARRLSSMRIVHADLKPDQYLVKLDTGSIVLSDYGLAGDFRNYTPMLGWQAPPMSGPIPLPEMTAIIDHFNSWQLREALRRTLVKVRQRYPDYYDTLMSTFDAIPVRVDQAFATMVRTLRPNRPAQIVQPTITGSELFERIDRPGNIKLFPT
jgi:serine/threonine protein kinase